MCGIFGTAGFNEDLTTCLSTLAHRGPDDSGCFYDKSNKVFLGHQRLSILDLSAAGRQPMNLNGSNIHITYNGEVYNFQSIKDTLLKSSPFQSATDTEVLLHLYKKHGDNTPKFLRGMFAFGIYDTSEHCLMLCRDRFGIKPLYYYHKDGRFAFASELQALKRVPSIDLEIDPVGLDYYFSYGYIPAPFSAYKYIRKLRPGHILSYNVRSRRILKDEPYWRLGESITSYPYRSEGDWLEAIESKINESVRLRLISDVPLGAFLSGGLDSSLVVSSMAKVANHSVKTFTIGFNSSRHDERPYSESVAKQYGTLHHVEVVKPDAIAVLPHLIRAYGEPFADPSSIPTYYLAQMARNHVTVALTGDGGDEVFGGYGRYARMHRYAYLGGIPLQIRKFFKYCGKYLPKEVPGYGFLQRQAFADTVSLYEKLHSCFPAEDRDNLYNQSFKDSLHREERLFYQRIIDEQHFFDGALITQCQTMDLFGYLPDDILTKVDRMSMLHSLEARVPLLDHELVELVMACPSSIRFKHKELKYIVRRLLADRVNVQILNRNKKGFGIPLSSWFKREWKGLLHSFLREDADDPVINNDYVRNLSELHQRNGRDFSKLLYAVLFYKSWNAGTQ